MAKHLSFISAFENGEVTYDEIIEGFQAMIDDGTVWSLQESYGRLAIDMIDRGDCVGSL
jgi:hypothetical protein